MCEERVVVFRVDHLAGGLGFETGNGKMTFLVILKNHLFISATTIGFHSAFCPSTAMYLLHLRVWKLR